MRPNLVLIVVDSLRFDRVGPRDGKQSLTPNLDRIAEQGIVFGQAISQGSGTKVAMSAIMSSTFASMYGGEDGLSDSRPVIQQMLKEAGYTTAAVSSNPHLSKPFGWARGFDYFDDCRPEEVYRRKLHIRLPNQAAKMLGIQLGWPESLPANLVFEKSRAYLRKPAEPFFLWIHLMDVHWPYVIQKFSWDPDWVNKRKQDRQLKTRFIARPPMLTREEHGQILEEYRRAVSFMDEQIGKFINYLEKNGQLKNTWVVISADHGEEFMDHGLYFHHPALFDELIHVPLIIRPPSGSIYSARRRYKKQVRMVDLVPTFLEIGQASQPEGVLVGSSLLPLLLEEAGEEDRPSLTESPGNRFLAYRSEGWKLIWNTESNERFLFDLAKDPGERQNLVEEQPQRAEKMATILEEHLRMVKADGTLGAGKRQELALDADLLEQLRNLGYVE